MLTLPRRRLLAGAAALAAASSLPDLADAANYTTWNPLILVTGTTFSNGNLKVQQPTGGAAGGAQSILSLSSGKYYYEATYSSDGSDGSPSIGFGIKGANLDPADTGDIGVIILLSGEVWVNGSKVATGTGMVLANTTVAGVAVDFTNSLIWFTVDGTHWNSSSSGTNNPATGVGGLSFSAFAGPFFAQCSWTGSAGSHTRAWTANFGASALSYSVPAGFKSGLTAGSVGGLATMGAGS